MKRSIGFVVFGLSVSLANPALAQTGVFGLGPRVTFQRGSETVPDSSFRIFGGQLKLRLNPSTAIEVSADYESNLNESLTQRAKTMPVQASLLVFMSRAKFAPYLLGGIGWYRHSLTQESGAADTSGAVTTTVRQTGYHAGLGAELRFGHVAIHGDYRYKSHPSRRIGHRCEWRRVDCAGALGAAGVPEAVATGNDVELGNDPFLLTLTMSDCGS